MWGTGSSWASATPDGRFIPTHVGNGDPASQTTTASTVHPHACGERVAADLDDAPVFGSSPRMWGTAASAQSGSGIERFIPTHVGNGSSTGVDYIRVAVHPHACGERLMPSVCTMTLIGSSPRMWGTVNPQQFDQWLARFIPTHVGNGRTSAPRPSVAAVHPHACGERQQHRRGLHTRRGSSPRMWGTVDALGVHDDVDRFIPTHVGNGEPAAI